MEAFDDRLWVLGGAYTLGSGPGSYLVFLNDVWNSVDGASWVQMPDAPWAPRLGHTSVVSDGKLWILGGWTKVGSDEAAEANDGWYMTAPPPLSFTRLPMGGWKEEGQPLTLDVGVTGGVGTPRYQWVKDGTDLPAATTDTYSIASLTLEDSGAYTCRVTDDSKALHETPPALITVVPAGSLPVCGVTTAALTALGCLLAALQRLAHRREHRDAT